MYTRIGITIFAFISVLVVRAQDYQLYPVKSGLIKYKFEGIGSGVETNYFDNYGNLLSVLKTTSLKTDDTIVTETEFSIFRNDTLFNTDIVIPQSKFEISKNYKTIN
jgi:hypothetical protein